MYKLAGLTDKEGKSKDETLEHIKKNHSLYGELHIFLYYSFEVHYFCFVYNDNSNQMLRSSTIENDEYVEEDKLRIITTENSIYYFEEVEDESIEK